MLACRVSMKPTERSNVSQLFTHLKNSFVRDSKERYFS
uniref:Uncharacterized protein n=2 Tax=Vibrio TaxID=662 RepID=A0A0H3ZQ70_9VIBR|nr:hypothetical protein [Vibrio tasmaniensis]AKN39318.1 hypothetical protein [Vibrio sp. FF_286]